MSFRRFVRTALALAPLALLLLAPAAAAQPAPAAPTVVTLKLSEYRFEPKEIDLDHGQSYVLRLSNVGLRDHSFSAKAFFQAAAWAPALKPWVRNGVVEIPQGQTIDIPLTAPDAGEYDFDCTPVMHEMLGMKGRIVVR